MEHVRHISAWIPNTEIMFTFQDHAGHPVKYEALKRTTEEVERSLACCCGHPSKRRWWLWSRRQRLEMGIRSGQGLDILR
jgi:hypothetical protein